MSYFNPDAIMKMLAESARYNAAVLSRIELAKQAAEKKATIAGLFKENRNEVVYGVLEIPTQVHAPVVAPKMQDFQNMMDKMVVLKPITSFAANANAVSVKAKLTLVDAKPHPVDAVRTIHGVPVYDDPKVISMVAYQRRIQAA
jgi:hypothetical protein